MRFSLCTILLLCVCTTLFAQQAPDVLPPLIEDEHQKDYNTARNETIHDILRKNIFVKAVASKSQVFAGEPFLVCYKLYTAFNSEARVIKQPVFEDCSVLELAIRKEPYPETINGKIFHVFELRKVQLTPVNAGVIQPGSINVESIVQVSAGENSVAENLSINSVNGPLNVQVKPLPVFTGEKEKSHIPIGHFFINASVAENKTGTGEKNNLQIKISGDGNFASVEEPVIKWPANVELFGSNSSSFLNQDDFPVTGYKVFDISFAGKTIGDITIPAVKLSFFNPDTGQYQLTETEPITVSFTNAINTDSRNNSITDYTNRKYLWIIPGIALVVFSVVMLTGKVKKRKEAKEAKAKKQEEKIEAEKQKPIGYIKEILLAKLEALYDENKSYSFLSGSKEILVSAIQFYTNTTGNIESDLLQRTEIKDISLAMQCRQWLNDINIHLYTQGDIELEHEKLYEKLKQMINKLCAE